MDAPGGGWLIIAIGLFCANLPFFSDRILLVLAPRSGVKGFGWRLLEIVLFYLLLGGAAVLLEDKLFGSRYAQGWEFYAITGCLFLVFAYPGFVYRYLWRSSRREAH